MKCSLALIEEIERLGGTPIMWRTGYPNIMAKRREQGAALAGEYSGHLFFNDPVIDFDDGSFAASQLLATLAAQPEPLSALVDRLPRYHSTAEERYFCADDAKFGVIERLHAHYEGTLPARGPRRHPRDVRGRLGAGARLEHRAGADHALRSPDTGARAGDSGAHAPRPRPTPRRRPQPQRRPLRVCAGSRLLFIECLKLIEEVGIADVDDGFTGSQIEDKYEMVTRLTPSAREERVETPCSALLDNCGSYW